MNNGAANSIYKSFNHPMPGMEQPSAPKSYGYEFSQYRKIYVIGDSITMHIFKERRPNIEYLGLRTALNTHTISRFTQKITEASKLREYGNEKENNTAIIVGSCAWDTLAPLNFSYEQPKLWFEINDHLDAMKSLLSFAKEKFSVSNVFWKGCTSVHQHVNDCMQFQMCSGHTMYVSSRRAKKLDKAQKEIANEFNISVLDMFDMSFEMAELNKDSRHFKETWNKYVIDYFYPLHLK